MLSEQRHEIILKMLEEKRSVTVTELTEHLGISESTARRDITILDKAGKLVKVFGGAVISDGAYQSVEPTVTQKVEINREEKEDRRICGLFDSAPGLCIFGCGNDDGLHAGLYR